MTQPDNGRALAPRVATATRIGQGTAVEQARAVAEVEAAIIVAQRHPRDVERAIAEMQRSCAQTSLAEKAFFRFGRGEGQVSGPSVQLAREIARCWGNFQSGLVELRRDDEARQSEMLAFAWDVETNYRTSTTFIVPHIRDTKRGPIDLTDMRDIYENNANMGARRLREMIFDSLPGWFTEDAVQACYRTLSGDDADLPQRIERCLAAFDKLGVTVQQLARKIGSPRAKWTAYDLATLVVIYRSLERGEINREDEFPQDRAITAADIQGTPKTAPAAAEGAAAGDSKPDTPKITKAALGKELAKYPLGEPADVAEFLAWRTGHQTLADMTPEQAGEVAAYLEASFTAADGDRAAATEAIWAEYRAEKNPEPAG